MFVVNMRPGELDDIEQGIRREVYAALDRAVADLAMATYGHIVEEVQKKLHSSREIYLKNLGVRPVKKGTWEVYLARPAHWIEDGMDRHEMIDDILNGGKPAKVDSKGNRYKIIPFKHNKAPTRSTQAMQDLQNVIKREFKMRGIPYGKLEMGPNGQPRLGRLHPVEATQILDKPLKTHEGVGQGHGPIGEVRQGMTGIPFLQGLTVYQNAVKTETNRMVTQKDMMTFRVISSKHKGTGRWVHPGVEAKRFFDEAHSWATTEYESKIKPMIVREIQQIARNRR